MAGCPIAPNDPNEIRLNRAVLSGESGNEDSSHQIDSKVSVTVGWADVSSLVSGGIKPDHFQPLPIIPTIQNSTSTPSTPSTTSDKWVLNAAGSVSNGRRYVSTELRQY